MDTSHESVVSIISEAGEGNEVHLVPSPSRAVRHSDSYLKALPVATLSKNRPSNIILLMARHGWGISIRLIIFI